MTIELIAQLIAMGTPPIAIVAMLVGVYLIQGPDRKNTEADAQGMENAATAKALEASDAKQADINYEFGQRLAVVETKVEERTK